jgi:signal transduction histidine kinase/DNA-binding response OmpR family regulator
MQALGVKILLMVPVFIHNSFWGFVSFDKRHTDEMFSTAEEAIVQPGSLLIANALLRNEYVQSIHDASEELEAALNTAEKANSAKSDFLASMSHEMRTPLNAVIGLSEIALDTENLSREAKLNLENIYTSGLTLLNIVNDILDVSKIQSGKFEIVPAQYDVPSMVNDAIIQNVMRIGSKPIRFILNIKANMYARLYGDELRIKQVINNLLSNAIKYTEKGLVMLDIDRERDGETVWLTIRVSDTGVGIKKENMKDLFVDFAQFGATAKQQAGGTGVGLSITQSLAEMMGGGLTVESTYGEGSEFTVRIMQKHVNDQTIGAAVAESLIGFQYSAVKRSSNTRRVQLPYASVLLVDDNVTNLEVAKGLLKPYRMKVDTVTSGRAAINLIREEGQRYNAIFMDHMMPEMDGIEALEHIREIGTEYARAIPIIALTANAIAGNEELFIAKGFQAFISKPIDINKLDAVINRFVRDKETERELLDQEQELNAPRLPEAAKLIGSLDTWEALSRCNWDEEVLTDILKSFASNTPEQLHKLDAYLEAGSLNDYAIVVHGIKGTSYAICAQAAGREAEALEVMAKKGDMLGVRSAHQSFVKTIGTLVGEINKAFAKSPKPAGASSKPDKYGFTAPDAEILIVEDNETNVKVAQGLLKPLEMRIDVAENGSVALRMIQNKEYDIIFMDHLMPVMDGIEATKRIRRLEGGYYQNVPVIALSAASESDVKAAFTQAGMNDFISKPIDITEICRKIKLWLPPSLVRETAPVMGVTVADEELPVIEGIDAGEGIRLLNSKEVFFNLLGDFYKLIDMKSARIKQYLDDGLIRDLTIEVHALKNTARLIGATALSDEFYQMEKYGDSGDILALEREIPGVLERYRSYKPILKPYGEAAEDGKRAATAGELTALLEKVKNSMDCFDLDAADGALKELDALQFPPECRGQMEDLRAYMADVAMEDVMKLADEMINAINAMGE